MKLNILLPWILAIGLGSGLAAVYVKSQAKEKELAQLRETAALAEQLQTQVAEFESRSQLSEDQVMVSRKDKDELIRLRGEVSQLRDQSKRLTQDLSRAQSQAEAARTEVAQVAQNAQSNAMMVANIRAERALQMQMNACVNNLRRLDGAKQQWALEHQKPATAMPQPAEIASYLGNAIPACPVGGTYTLNAVNQPPTCSDPSHKLPQQ
ncbi:MAG TPA: hypothetical protein VEH04_19985 [Verrucomicrobiae bacterium]|nr:hypothetical protein [Verrucomicrobiae bacterium]